LLLALLRFHGATKDSPTFQACASVGNPLVTPVDLLLLPAGHTLRTINSKGFRESNRRPCSCRFWARPPRAAFGQPTRRFTQMFGWGPRAFSNRHASEVLARWSTIVLIRGSQLRPTRPASNQKGELHEIRSVGSLDVRRHPRHPGRIHEPSCRGGATTRELSPTMEQDQRRHRLRFRCVRERRPHLYGLRVGARG